MRVHDSKQNEINKKVKGGEQKKVGKDEQMREFTSVSQKHVPDRHTAIEARSLIAQDKSAFSNVSPSTYKLETGIEPTT